MNHRKTLGFESDVAESAALTIADERATERIYEACDWEHDRKKEKNKIDNKLRMLDEPDRAFARAVLCGKSWQDLGMPKSTFSVKLKKVEKVLSCR
jgi:hypothetical protein